MITDVIRVSSRGDRMEEALAQVDKMTEYKGLSHKGELQLRLLTEEMMAMMRSITGEAEGDFWIEDSEGVYRLHLLVDTIMNSQKRDQLLSASSTGKNISARGIMGRLRDFFDRGADEDVSAASNPLYLPEMYDHSTTPAMDWEWSMIRYESALSNRVSQSDTAALDAWDELEKSVVKNVADDVSVSIRGRTVEMIITKKI